VKIFSYIIVLLIIVLGITFAILNAPPVTVHYYVGVKQMPLSLLLVISFGAGLLISFLVMMLAVIRLKTERRRLRKKLRIAEKEIDNLRVIPVKD
jgi:lipopolysaccharide assembly protein A